MFLEHLHVLVDVQVNHWKPLVFYRFNNISEHNQLFCLSRTYIANFIKISSYFVTYHFAFDHFFKKGPCAIVEINQLSNKK